MQRSAGVTVIAAIFFTASVYLAGIGLLRLFSDSSVPLSLGAPLLHGLEISGPYTFLLSAVLAAIIAIGLLRLRNLARRAAIAVAVAGIVMLVPKVSADAAELSLRLLFPAAAVMTRVIVVWYLWQSSTAQ